jgi:hypothetical protein
MFEFCCIRPILNILFTLKPIKLSCHVGVKVRVHPTTLNTGMVKIPKRVISLDTEVGITSGELFKIGFIQKRTILHEDSQPVCCQV